MPAVNIANVKLASPPAYKVNLYKIQITINLKIILLILWLTDSLFTQLGESVATRLAYGNGLQKLAQANSRVIALDGDTKNSTFSDKVLKVRRVESNNLFFNFIEETSITLFIFFELQATPKQYIECYIAEQNLVGIGIGVACRDRAITFASTFACFFSRAFDQVKNAELIKLLRLPLKKDIGFIFIVISIISQLRMGAISQTNLNCCGSHAGISIGEDGPSQMGLEDIAMFRTVAGSTVFYPSDAVSAERAVELAANTKGVCFIRTSRPNTPVIYENDKVFQAGKASVVRQSANDNILLIGAGVTLYEALSAADELAKIGISARVIDPFTIKPLDPAIIEHAKAVGGRVLTVEDHYPEGNSIGIFKCYLLISQSNIVIFHCFNFFVGGIGEAVASLLSGTTGVVLKKLAVTEIPRSGPPTVLLEKFGISANCVVKAAKELLGQ